MKDEAHPRPRKWLFRLGALVSLTLIAAWLTTATFVDDARVIGFVVGELNGSLRGSFTVGGGRYRPWSELSLEDLVVRDPAGEIVLQAAAVTANVDLVALLWNRLELRLTDLEAVTVAVSWANEDELPGLVQAFEARDLAAQARAVRVFIPDVVAALDLDHPAARVSVERIAGEGLELVADADETRITLGALEVPALGVTLTEPAISLGGVTLSLGPTSWRLNQNGNTLRTDAARWGWKEQAVEGSASARWGVGAPQVTFDGTIAADLSEPALASVLPAYDPLMPLAGKLATQTRLALAENRLTASAQGSLKQGGIAGIAVTAMTFAAKVEENRLEIIEVDARGPAGGVRARGFAELVDGAVRHELHLTLKDVELARLAAGRAPADLIPARANGRVSLAGRNLVALRTRLDADLVVSRPTRLPASLPEAIAIRGRADVTPSVVTLRALSLGGDDATLRLDGPVNVADGTVELGFRLESSSHHRALQPWLGSTRLRRLEVTGRVSGAIDDPAMVADASLSDLEPPRGPGVDATAHLALVNGLVTLERAELRAAGGRAEASGSIRLRNEQGESLAEPDLALEARYEGLDLQAYLPGTSLTGAGRGQVSITGTPASPRAHVELTVAPLGFEGVSLAQVSVVARVDPERVEVESLEVSDPMVEGCRAAGVLHIATRAIEGSVSAARIELPAVVARLPSELPVTGTASASGRLWGDLDDPRWSAEVTVPDLRVAGVRAGETRLSAEGGALAATIAATSRGPAGVTETRLELDDVFTRVAGTVRLSSIQLRTLLDDLQVESDADALLAGEITLTGALRQPRVEATLVGRDVVFGGRAIAREPLQLIVTTTDSGYRISARSPPALAAVVDVTPKPLRVESRGSFSDIDLVALYPEPFPKEVGLTTSGRFEVSISDEPLFARVVLTSATVASPQESMSLVRPATVLLEGRDLRLGEVVLRGPRTSLTVRGHVGEEIELAARGKFDPDLLTPFINAPLEFSGPLRVEASVRGPRAAPLIEGRVAVEEPIEIDGPGWPSALLLRRGTVVLGTEAVQIQDVEGELMGGDVEVAGRIGLVQLTPASYDVRIRGSGLELATADTLMEGDVTLNLTGEGHLPRVGGNVELLWGRYNRVFTLKDFVFKRNEGAALSRPPTSPWLDGIAVDLVARNVEPMTIGVEAGAVNLQLELTSDVQVTGTAGRPEVEGRLSTTGGRIRFPAADLDITNGAIDFTPSVTSEIGGAVYLRAEGEVIDAGTTYTIQATLEGNLRAVSLTLTATPSLEALEILTLLATGRRQLTSGDGEQAQVALGVLGAQLSRPVTNYLQRQLEQALSLEVDLDSTVTPDNVKVTLGKDLHDRLRLEGSYSHLYATSASEASLRAKFYFSDWLLLEGGPVLGGDSGTAAESGDLQLRWRLLGD